MGGTKGNLLDLLKVIKRISVQLEHSYFDQRVVLMRPDFSYVKDIPFVVLSVFLRHDLSTEFPLWIVFGLD